MPASDLTPSRAAAALLLAGATCAASAAATFAPDPTVLGWTSRPVLTSYNLKSGSEIVYRSSFSVGDWSGGLFAQMIDNTAEVSSYSPWTAPNFATLLDAQNWDTGRRIVTRNAAGGNVPFRLALLSTTQQKAIGTDGNGKDNDKLLNFVRGDRSDEDPNGRKWRKRTTVLGDIQHSTLLYWKYAGGDKRLFFGANDGMVHVVDAASGNEVFAYIPSMLVGKLNKLAVKPYLPTFFADGPLTVGEVSIGGSAKTLLAGGLGGGERGLFMLDVSDPAAADENAAAAKIKWEITPASTGFANLGYTYSAPRFSRLNDAGKTPVVIVGNGHVNAGNGHAALFVINADTGALIREIDTGAGTTASPNGLSSPTVVDADGNGTADYVYAGDIDGKLWKFDLTSASSASFSASLLYTTSPAQAITVAPATYPHPNGGRMVLFGTGRTLSATDRSDTAVSYAYGVWDGAPVANTTLLAQTLTSVTVGSETFRYASANVPNWTSGNHRGWRLTLGAGERIAGQAPFINEDRFYFTTVNPTVAAAGSGQPSGDNWSVQVSALTGGSTGRSVFDVNSDDKVDDADKIQGEYIVGESLGAGVVSQPVLVDLQSFSVTLFNQVSDADGSVSPPPAAGPGVSGGHFDVDIYYSAAASNTTAAYKNQKHTHQYDDKYNVTGVNFLSPSDAAFNVANAVPNATVPFKILIANQYLSPASMVAIGSSSFVSVKDYAGLASQTNATTLWNSLPTYTRASLGVFTWALPLDAFASKDWWGDGGAPRAGLIPNVTGCVHSVTTKGVTSLGPNGERYKGALTITLVRADMPVSMLEMNYPGGGAKYGWRVKSDGISNYSWVLGEYTLFWHHPNGKCYGDAGWVANAPQDTAAAKTKITAPPAGSADPTGGSFASVGSLSGATVTSVNTSTTGSTTTITTTYSDGKTETTSTTDNGDGTETVVMVDRDGNRSEFTRVVGSSVTRGTNELLVTSRRITWREVVRP